MRSHAILTHLATIACMASACAQVPVTMAREPAGVDGDPESMQLDRARLLESGLSPGFVLKLERSRFSYFRMLADAFEARTCEAFRDIKEALPTTAVQGDAHLEQFAVTADSYGLDDFDRGGFGPAVVDLVRYAASLHVACADVTWRCDADAAVERFLTAYRITLIGEPVLRQPAVVQRLRAKAPSTRARWLSDIDARIVPLPPALESDVRRSWARFAKLMRDVHADWTASSLNIVRLGWIRIGVGSALERKVMIRIAGPTDEPDDDVLVEAREGTSPDPRSCIWRAEYGESPVLLVMSTLGRRMPELHGFAAMLENQRSFWLQSWDPHYTELSLSDVTSQSELNDLVTDAAQQLASPVWTSAPERLRRYQRYAHAAALDETRARIIDLARPLAAETTAAWERFRISEPRVIDAL